VLPCSDKSKLIHTLEKMVTTNTDHADQQEQPDDSIYSTTSDADHCRKIAVVDGMALIQKLSTKAAAMVTVKDLSVCINDRLVNLTRDFDEVIVVFDTYRADSLKNRTRQKRRKEKDPVHYQVRDTTSIQHITLSRFLSHDQTKANLTEYLTKNTLDYNKDSPKLIITSAAGHTRSNRDVGPFPDNKHEEADTLMICLGVSATEQNPVDAQMTFFSSDTDVLVLIIANYDRLPKTTSISMASSVQQIEPLWAALGSDRAKALPGLLAFSGADNTGRFARIGKPTWFKLFMEAEGVIEALCTFCDDADVSEDLQFGPVCLYCILPKGHPALKHSRVALAPVLQIHGRK